ncbi:MAG: RNA polymerase sigma factor [Myxococcota bacterium]|nr:RNA polymerase sigma factor [Myxococcota bacterium]
MRSAALASRPRLAANRVTAHRNFRGPDARELQAGLVALLPDLQRRAIRLCGERATADDIVQDTIERALRFSGHYERGTNLRAWALRILFRVFVTRWRRRRREHEALEGLSRDPCAWTCPAGFLPPDGGSGALMPSAMRKLEALPDGFGAVVVLVDLEDHSYRDAAGRLGVPIGTVMSRLHRGRRMLAESWPTKATQPELRHAVSTGHPRPLRSCSPAARAQREDRSTD